MSDDRLLPPGTSTLEVAAARAAAEIARVPVLLRTLWSPESCPTRLLPYLAWTLSVDRWDENWPEATKRSVIASAFYIHKHKGTISALRRVVEPLGFLIQIREWWQTDEQPGTFRLVVGVQENGITEAMFQELERLINDAKPASRHLTGLSISLSTDGAFFVGANSYGGDELTIYPYVPESITVSGGFYPAQAIHLVDNMRVTA
ncbi:phage tail protein I [Siccibacter colletis]|uniref:Phage tail protein I n=1 Tax=Siccibacter colletis TaxID=1505757 RepID=A0ABY6JIE4_9ENTR|nr:phage tail protein I [Siccibacter colletis]UYU32459.1 phage tail protein I [Siccibacter colletis]